MTRTGDNKMIFIVRRPQFCSLGRLCFGAFETSRSTYDHPDLRHIQVTATVGTVHCYNDSPTNDKRPSDWLTVCCLAGFRWLV